MKHTQKTEQGGRSDIWRIGVLVSSIKTRGMGYSYGNECLTDFRSHNKKRVHPNKG